MRLQDLENVLAVFLIRLVAGRAERRAGSLGDVFKVLGGFQAEIDKVLTEDAADAVKGAINRFHIIIFPEF